MATWGSCDFKQLEQFQKRLEKLQKADMQKFCRAASKDLAARLLRKVIPRTKIGEYPKSSGKVGGTLRRGWTGEQDMNATAYAASLPIAQTGNTYTITIINPVKYAAYVEYGHRTRGGKGWVDGKFMLTKSEMELQAQLPKIIEKKLIKFLGETFNND